jgi:hypothetical protein
VVIKTSIFLVLISTVVSSYSQNSKIKVRKPNDQLYFFQKGTRSDTIVKGRYDLFYLIIPDSLKRELVITVNNGNFRKVNDSIVQLLFIPGIKYECVYEERIIETGQRPYKKTKDLKCMINGVTEESGNSVEVIFKKKDAIKPLLENKFIFLKRD